MPLFGIVRLAGVRSRQVHEINHVGDFFKVKGPPAGAPSPQVHPVLLQAGGSPRGIKASAHIADHVFAAGTPTELKVQHRKELDAELVAQGRGPQPDRHSKGGDCRR